MARFASAFALVTFVVFSQAASAASCSDAGTTVDASTDFSSNNNGTSYSPLMDFSAPHCEREWVHEGKKTPANKKILLQANWQGTMPLPKYPKPANPTPGDIATASAFETECHKANVTAEFWVKSGGDWRAILSPVLQQIKWRQSGVWNDATWTCSMPLLHTTASNVEAVRVAGSASYGVLDAHKEKPSKVTVYMQTL